MAYLSDLIDRSSLPGLTNATPKQRRARLFYVAAIVIVLAVIAGLQRPETGTSHDAVVERVVDGDTVDLRIGGESVRVRILNVNTPETKHPEIEPECLGAEASEFLANLLPRGTRVTVDLDGQKYDRHGRTLAWLIDEQGRHIGEEILRNGYGQAVSYGDNKKHLQRAIAAEQQAAEAKLGLYSPEIACTLSAQLEGASAQLPFAAPATATPEELEAIAGKAETVLVALVALSAIEPIDEAVDSLALIGMRPRLADLSAAATAARDRYRAEAHALAATREAERLAAELAAAEQAAAEQAAIQRAAEEARRAAQVPAPAPAPPSGGYDGYTGCRAYGPGGTSIDEKGRRYTKISCS